VNHRRTPGFWLRAAALLAALTIHSIPAVAQTVSVPPERPIEGDILDADLIRDLPTGDNLFQLLEATQPTLITDRFFSGGLYTGQSARISGFLGSWTQSTYRLGDLDITDPTGSGTPLIVPDLFLWNAVNVATGLMPAHLDSTGLAVSLDPRTPASAWTRTLEAAVSHFGSVALSDPPQIARLDGWDHFTALASGPLTNRLGLVAAGSWTNGSQFERAETDAVSAISGSGFANLVFTPNDRDQVKAIGWAQHTSTPFPLRTAVGQPDARSSNTVFHLQSTWARHEANRPQWRAFGGFSRGHRIPGWNHEATVPVFERLTDGPLTQVAGTADEVVHQWSLGGRVGSPPSGIADGRHHIEIGGDLTGASATLSSFFSGAAGELVAGGPARVWRFSSPGTDSRRHELGFAAFASDRITVTPRITVDAALRFDSVSGSADDAAEGITWRTLAPRAHARWTITDRFWRPAFTVGYARSAYRLPLDLLAYGDPASPYADVYRWNAFAGTPATVTTVGPLVERVGPGTRGDDAFSSVDPDLKRPVADEIIAGLDWKPGEGMRFRILGIARQESNLVGLLNTGAPQYTLKEVPDAGPNAGSPEDDRLVPVYNRLIQSFGLDRYLLTSGLKGDALFNGVQIDAEMVRPKYVLRLGATAGRAIADAAHVGYGPLENDQSLVGDVNSDPNSSTFARGRLFNDRAFTGKIVGVYRFPNATTLGFLARYMDGQPFARLIVDRSLNQGAEAVRAFVNGDHRFTFVTTLDLRLQKRFIVGSNAFDAVVDIYNVPSMSSSVEEETTNGPDVRVSTAVQPPFTLHAGIRLTF
jgi:hypothetical protein